MGVKERFGAICWAAYVRPLAWATLVANIGIVVSGGAVRLTASGLGCPTWPKCTDDSFTPHGELELHSAIEFGNRMLTFVLTAIAIATLVAAWHTGRRELRQLAVVLALGIVVQAVIGGITVRTGLNSWVVALHLMVSMVMIALAVLLLRLVGQDGPLRPATSHRALRGLAWTTFAAGWVVLYVGTVVTGSGPHAGDIDVARNGFDPVQVSQLHADAVFLLIGLTVGLLFAAHATGASAEVVQAARLLLVVELAQGLIGFVQYFTDLPEVLVGAHMLGAAVVAAAMTWAVLATREG